MKIARNYLPPSLRAQAKQSSSTILTSIVLDCFACARNDAALDLMIMQAGRVVTIALKYLGVLCILIPLTLFTASCAWHLRNAGEVPAQLKVLHVDTDDIDSHFRVQLINLLKSMQISLVKTPTATPFTLHVYNYSLEHDNPAISSTNIAITYTYTLRVTVSITDAHGKTVVQPHNIRTTRDVTVNTNQIFTINSTSIFQQELQREAINLLYYWLISDKTHRSLISAQEKPETRQAPLFPPSTASMVSMPQCSPLQIPTAQGEIPCSGNP